MSPGEPARLDEWFAARGHTPLAFQRETWRRSLAGESGLVHAPTGQGKTLAAWFGPVAAHLDDPASQRRARRRTEAPALRVLWLTPLRALAEDLGRALSESARELVPGWTVEVRTGDSSSSARARHARRLPTALVTTPESLSLLLSHADAPERFAALRTVVVDEWHELLGTKRGTQTELALARLRALAPGVATWGLSATLGNLDEALAALVGVGGAGTLVAGPDPTLPEIVTVLPRSTVRFPWAGHLGPRLLEETAQELDRVQSSLVFVNTRSQAELWYQALRYARPERREALGLHHGSLDRAERAAVEAGLADGRLWATVATSSLDLGVDFAPVVQVVQVGSPKGVARFLQRAGRSGHAPGRVSRIILVPTNALELAEFAALRAALGRRELEPRVPLDRPLDVLAQHVVTVALGGGFAPDELLREVRGTVAFRALDDEEWRWVLDFCRFGGPALRAYERYARIREVAGRFVGGSESIAREHRASIGTIASFGAVSIVLRNGRELGTVEELFVGRLKPGDTFTFAGRALALVRLEADRAVVRPAKGAGGPVPRWWGGRLPFTDELAASLRRTLDEAAARIGASDEDPFDAPELAALRPLFELQAAWSHLPRSTELLVERVRTRDGDHAILYPLQGRLVHEGLASLLALRISRLVSTTLSLTMNDWGLALTSRARLPVEDEAWSELLSPDGLAADVLEAVDAVGLARRHFREVARVAGLVHGGAPHRRKSRRQLQASAGLVFDVLREHDPSNLLLVQARREVLERTLELTRLASTLRAIASRRVLVVHTPRLTPFAFPLWADRTRERASSEDWEARVRALASDLERRADGEQLTPAEDRALDG